jgi:zinc and cadmium transporter
MALFFALLSTFAICLLSLIGALTLSWKSTKLQPWLLSLVGLSAGSLLGAVFFHLLPEAHHELGAEQLYPLVLASMVGFFLVEKILHWHHCHLENCEVHTFGYMNLLGDAMHNFLDGMILGATFLTDIRLGLISALAIALHELPQEIGDFGVLLHAGFTKTRAVLLNLAVSGAALLGVITSFALAGVVDSLASMLVPIAAGGFLYIAMSDLLPELKNDTSHRWWGAALSVVVGILVMYIFTQLVGEPAHG